MIRLLRRVLSRAERMLRVARYRRYAAHGQPVPFSHQGRTYYLNPDPSSAYHISESVAKIQRLVDLMTTPPQIVIDVGANCGLFAAFVEAKYPGTRIYCIEPSPDLIPYIRRNCGPAVTVIECALADHDGMGVLYVNSLAQQTNSLVPEAVKLFSDDESIVSRPVNLRSLDSIAAEYGIDGADVIKVDVQGFEGAVFRGAKRLLASTNTVFVESTWLDVGSTSNLLPFATRYGFHHIGVVNPVYMGADLVLAKQPPANAGALALQFTLDDPRLRAEWY